MEVVESLSSLVSHFSYIMDWTELNTKRGRDEGLL